MTELTVAELATMAEAAFGGSRAAEFRFSGRETFGEDSFGGGFRLLFSAPGSCLEVVYSDLEIEVSVDGREIFGSNVHDGFGGNMFSRENLQRALPRIAASAWRHAIEY